MKSEDTEPKDKKIRNLLLVGLLILSLGSNAYFILQNWPIFFDVNSPSEFPLLNPLLQFLKYDSAEERRANTVVGFSILRQDIEAYTGDRKKQVGVYVEDLNTGSWMGINEKQKFVPASLIKVAFAMAALKKVEKGIWTVETPLLLQPKFKNKKYGELWKLPDMSDVPLQRVVEEMIISSDNTAVSMIYQSLTREEREDIFYHIGQRNPDENPEFPYVVELYSPKELANAYRVLYNASFLTRKNSEYLLELLSKTKFRNELPRSIPSAIAVAHKIGEATRASTPDLPNVSLNDCGIVYYPIRPYIICALTEGIALKDASDLIAAVSEKTYTYINEYSERNQSN